MPTYQTSSVIDAPFDRVWAFYDDAEGLEVLTPDWLGLARPTIVGPDGEPEPDAFRPGTKIRLELKPLGLSGLPGSEWVVEIVEREVDDDRARFVDEQVIGRGPFRSWRHTHRFVNLGGETLLVDRIDYRLPRAGDLALATPALAALLWYRHRRTRQLLEADQAAGTGR
ncbi:cyclase [Halovivax asiaticus JCM 14624]|uniref:Cyclase n=1 Tax=Halovivax asiaticus JCM 14624 TaxID=1227490 RepID=M0BI32_9EURY|nr:SRPBCC family protein [Halovivax asiaticus]ELZ09963.1 cyclase [Halovivax asiaticus JCM 14624]